ncbi:MAG TPA: M20 family metallopeptidase [Anaerolineae bacterium]|nr:M20 family metallopeptidase [Anaerolineae bacterium]
MKNVEELKGRLVAEIDARRDELIQMADRIHAHPEVAFREFASAALLCSRLEEEGFVVERGVAGLETAFVATLRGQGDGPTVALLAEYDALPGLGHACGHNLIGTAAVGAGLAMKAVMPELAGNIQVIGTPGEEGGGGKAILVDGGAFAAVDAAMMVHPSSKNLTRRTSLTSYKIQIEFYGKPAHAAAKPDEGINALDALILTYNGINALRQHLRDDARVHGIITHGGDAPNIVPEYTQARFYVRAADTPYTLEVIERIRGCAEGGARATNARLVFSEYAPHYDNRLPNEKLYDLAEANMAMLGLELSAPDERMGSSDMGNVSQVVPSIHPYVAIGPEDMGGHTAEFCEAAGSPAGHEGMLKAAKILAMTAVDLLAVPNNLVEAKEAFEAQKRQQGG